MHELCTTDATIHALNLMRDERDEAKFAGLLLLIKHLNSRPWPATSDAPGASRQSENDNVRRRVLEAITPQFLGRLLVSSPKSPDQLHFQGVGLAVLGTLARDPTLLPRLLPLLKHVLAVLDKTLVPTREHAEGFYEEEQAETRPEWSIKRMQLLEDCLLFVHLLTRDSRSMACLEALATHQAFGRVSACLVHLRQRAQMGTKDVEGTSARSGSAASKEAGARQGEEGREEPFAEALPGVLSQAPSASIGGHLAAAADSGSPSCGAKSPPAESKGESPEPGGSPEDRVGCAMAKACLALEGMLLLEKELGLRLSVVVDGEKSLAVLASALEEASGELKVRLAQLLNLFLLNRRGTTGTAVAWARAMGDASHGRPSYKRPRTGQHVRGALLQLLHGGLRETHRDPALAVLVHMLALFGQGWVLDDEEVGEAEVGGGECAAGHGTGRRHGKSVVFLVHALSAEARMAAEELQSLGHLEEDILGSDFALQRRRERALRILPLCVEGLEAVLRFLCGAGNGPECVIEGNESSARSESRARCDGEWWMLPGENLLDMRASLHDALGAFLRLLQDGAGEWRQTRVRTAGGPDRVWEELGEELEAVFREVVAFMSAMLSEDEGCLSAEETLDVLPFFKAVVGEDPRWMRPWVSRAMLLGIENGDDDAEASIRAIDRLVDECQIHHWFVKQLKRPTRDASEQGQHVDLLFIFHEIIVRGGQRVICDDVACLLLFHPSISSLVPDLVLDNYHPSSSCLAFTSSSSVRLGLHRVWFVLSILWERAQFRSGSEGKRGIAEDVEYLELQGLLDGLVPPGSETRLSWLTGIGRVLVEGGKALISAPRCHAHAAEGPKLTEAERDEISDAWKQSMRIFSYLPRSVQQEVLQRLRLYYNAEDLQALEDEWVLLDAAAAVL